MNLHASPSSRRVAAGLALATGLSLLLPMTPAPALLVPTSRVNVSSAEAQANAAAVDPDVSGTGRFVVFSSRATNLTAGDTNGVADVFVRDRSNGTTRRVSLTNTGRQANGASFDASISADGRYVAFVSAATNLIAGDTNAVADVFVRDLYAAATRRVSISYAGDAQANGRSSGPSISDDGTAVAFASAASNLANGDTNGVSDVFVRDLAATTTTRVSLGNEGQQGNAASSSPAVNATGTLVYFTSAATNLVAGDTNEVTDVFARHLAETTTARVSVTSDGGQANGASTEPAVDDNGYTAAFTSEASNLVPADTNGVADVFLRRSSVYLDQPAPVTRVSVTSTGASVGAAPADDPDINDDGRYVLFRSNAGSLVPDDSNGVVDAFVRDTFNSTTFRMSTTSLGGQVSAATTSAAISSDGRSVAFASAAANVVTGDTNGVADVFVSFANAPRLLGPAVMRAWDGTPQDIAFLPDGRMLVTEALGTTARIAMYGSSSSSATLLSRKTVGTLAEEPPGYATRVLGLDTVRTNGTTYVYACVPRMDDIGYRNQVVRYRATASSLVFDRYIIRRGVWPERWGDGCAVRVGPDRKLWIATGTGSRDTLAIKPRALNGKVLRVNLDGTIPADNPTPGSSVYTLGHRAPVAIVFTPGTNRPYVVERGPGMEDEINRLRAGANYGWPCGVGTTPLAQIEGCNGYSTYAKPAWASGPDATISPSGAEIPQTVAWRAWRGDLVVGNAVTDTLHRFVFNATGTRAFQQEVFGSGLLQGTASLITYDGARGLRVDPSSGGVILSAVGGEWEDPDEAELNRGNVTARLLPRQ